MSFSHSSFYFVFSFCLDDESEHPALGSAEHVSCSFVVAHVPAPQIIVGVTRVSNRCNRCRSQWDWDVSSCRCLANADQAHRVLCCTWVVSYKYFSFRSKYLDMHLVDFDFSQLVTFLVCKRIGYCLGGFRVPALPYFFEVRDHVLSCFQEFTIMSTSSANLWFEKQSLFHHSVWCPVLFFTNFNVFLHC